mgnify:CR=1 FL=1
MSFSKLVALYTYQQFLFTAKVHPFHKSSYFQITFGRILQPTIFVKGNIHRCTLLCQYSLIGVNKYSGNHTVQSYSCFLFAHQVRSVFVYSNFKIVKRHEKPTVLNGKGNSTISSQHFPNLKCMVTLQS